MMYVCIVRMYYVCMYVFMYVCNVRMYVCNVRKYVRKYVFCMYVCTYVCICLYLFLYLFTYLFYKCIITILILQNRERFSNLYFCYYAVVLLRITINSYSSMDRSADSSVK